MTSAAPDPALDAAARQLAAHHAGQSVRPGAAPLASLVHVQAADRWLDAARRTLAEPDPAAAKAAEWLLDNDYRVERAVRQLVRDLPSGFYRRLPAFDGRAAPARPRAYVVAHAFLRASHLQVSLAGAVTFIRGYQDAGVGLTIAELWAFPALLRLACLELLVTAFEHLVPTLRAPFDVVLPAPPPAEDTETVARSLSNLAVIAAIPWQEFFEATSQVEAVLRQDPAGVYARMDFETRDRYRAAVEEVAEWAGRAEPDVARALVDQATRQRQAREDDGHIGWWLIADGRPAFERMLGARPPRRLVLARWGVRHARLLYAAALALAVGLALVTPVAYLWALGASPLVMAAGTIVTLLPGSVVAITLLHWILTVIVHPRILPKLDSEHGVPDGAPTAVAIPVLVGGVAEATSALDRLEEHYLANPGSDVQFVLLTTPPDAPTESVPTDDALEAALASGITRLNTRYGTGSHGPFHLLHRHRRHNAAEGCWMGWERKRGALVQFNRLILGGPPEDLARFEGDVDRLRRVRFVVTVDLDTRLTQGTVAQLAATLAHPLNRARFEDGTGRVRSGYTIVQPRVEIAPESGTRSLFARLYAGDTAIDIYSRAVSNVYQDLFGSGIYVGKGIYDVAGFERSLDNRVPINALVSHDLFEGAHGRVALASDIVLYEDFPTRYEDYARRSHRWMRGDWQLLPWLGRQVPGADGRRLPNRLTALERWTILDNLRRSLMAPSLLLLFMSGWTWLPGRSWVWTVLAVLSPGASLFTDLVTGLSRGRRRGAVRGLLRQFADHTGRWSLAIVFLVEDALLAVDAVVRTLVRLLVTRRRLLEWTTAAAVARQSGAAMPGRTRWRLLPSPAIALAFAVTVALVRPAAFWTAGPVLLLWTAAPAFAWWIGRPRRWVRETLDADARAFLRRLARRTWLFYERFAAPDDHWLPPDNFQEYPGGDIAHRTSPTNIGMYLLSSVAAADLGFIGLPEFARRSRNLFDTLDRLDRYEGHFLNWYDTQSLAPLEPRYVSTVDSGNLAVSLLTVKEACHEALAAPPLHTTVWLGLRDVLDLLDAAVANLPAGAERTALHDCVRTFMAHAEAAAHDPDAWPDALVRLTDEREALDRLVTDAVHQPDVDWRTLQEIRVWVERIHHHLHAIQRDVGTFRPWIALLADAPADAAALVGDLRTQLAPTVSLGELPARCRQARAAVAAFAARPTAEADGWTARLLEAFAGADRDATALADLLGHLAREAEAFALAMNFRLLFDAEPRLFRIGHNLSADRPDPHHYDLLATEARLASLFAIAKGDAPVSHWFHLGRPLTSIGGRLTLVSWGGSSFEYLMPPLLCRSHPGGLLTESERTAVAAQQRFARAAGVPWGCSESGFAALDPGRHYRYQTFGVPALALRRGHADELVIAPYASALALPVTPRAAAANLRALADLGLVGLYGLYEAADFGAVRVPRGETVAIVRSWMAHHQGMILAAIDNVLCDDALVRRFHADRRIRSVELLLQERVPRELPPEAARGIERGEPPPARPTPARLPSWSPAGPAGLPHLHVLGNGRLSSRISDGGAGGLFWQGQALTRWTPDPTGERDGVWLYVRDDEDHVWSAGAQPTRVQADESSVVLHAHMVEFHRRDRRIALRMDVGVLPGDDAEVRRIRVHNEDDRPRTLTFTTCGEVVLAPPLSDERHPAFSKLFVHSAWVPAATGLLFTRRPRQPEEHPPVLLHSVVVDPAASVEIAGYETDRRAFFGRLGDRRRPHAVTAGPSRTTGWTLDPIFALEVRIRLEPGQRGECFFLTAAAGSEASVREIRERYATPTALDWALDDAAQEAAHEASHLAIDPGDLPRLQALASLVLAPDARWQAAPGVRDATRLGQAQLWGLGISGDLPILLLRVADPEGALLATLVRGHELWRRRGLGIDLVVVRAGPSSYDEPIRRRLLDLMTDAGGRSELGRPGGVHLVMADQIGGDVRALLESSARVILDDAAGDLGRQLAEPADGGEPGALPRFRVGPPAAAPPDPPQPRPADLLFDNGLGGFSPDGREYVTYLAPGVVTPAPWCNVLANDLFGTIVSEAGLGFTWAGNSGENRLTPWNNDPVLDTPGEVLYLRDEEDGRIWTPTPEPAGPPTPCEVRHGAGYSTWTRRSHGFEQHLQVFVPPEDPVKLMRLRLRNLRDRPRRITVTGYVEWMLGALRSVAAPHVVTGWDPDGACLRATSRWNAEFADRMAFLTATVAPHALTTDRREFLGVGGDLGEPQGLGRWGLSGRTTTTPDPCAAYQVHLDVAAGEAVEVVFALGEGDTRDHAVALAKRWRDPAQVERGWQAVTASWDRVLGAIAVRTPDPAFDLVVNRWLPYQALASRVMARAGFYQAGGAFGFRDQLQDMLALLHADPARVRAHILACAARQFEEGDVLHWWHPPSDRGVRTHCSDDLLWLPWVTGEYVAATGDRSILAEGAPFLRGPVLEAGEHDRYARFDRAPDEQPIFEHCARALDHAAQPGPHGLPLIGSGDWNDGFDRLGVGGRGESVWLAWFAGATLTRFAEVCAGPEEASRADRWRARAAQLAAAVEASAWDGDWYVRAYDDDGRPLGSRTLDECRIDSIAQSWAVLSGLGQPDRARHAVLAAVRELSDADHHLIRLLWPPFDGTPDGPGYIEAYPPGIRENGGQYTHAAAWLGLAFARLRDAERTADIMRWLNPVHRTATAEGVARHRTEPYALAADIASVSPHAGQGGWTWYTGSAAWTWRLATEGVLGLRLVEGRLGINPCLPPDWDRAEAVVRGPSGTLAVVIEPSTTLAPDRQTISVDGVAQASSDVAFPTDGSTRAVHVSIGRAASPVASSPGDLRR